MKSSLNTTESHGATPVLLTGSSPTGSMIFLTPTTDSAGVPIMVTEDLSVSHRSTATAVVAKVSDSVLSAASTPDVMVAIVEVPEEIVTKISTVVKVVTTTVTRVRDGDRSLGHGTTVAHLDGHDYPLTNDIQTINDATVVKVLPQNPMVTAFPIAIEDLTASESLFGTPRALPSLSSEEHRKTASLVHLDHTSFFMTKPTQTVGHRVFVNDPLNKYRLYHPYNHAVAPTGTCDTDKSMTGNDCNLDRCMWNFMKPMNVSTVEPVEFHSKSAMPTIGYITHQADLRFPHWGTSTTTGLYYPTSVSHYKVNGTMTHDIIRATPSWLENDGQIIHDAPVCHDMESCHSYCQDHSKNFPWISEKTFKWIIYPLLAAIILFFALCLCCGCLRRRKKNDPNRKNSLKDKLRRKSSIPPEVVVVNQVTGTATDPSTGQAVDPSQANAIMAGSAAGAEAGREKQGESTTGGDDGKGTTGRRAEEGRGRVNFEDGGRPGNDPPAADSNAANAGGASSQPGTEVVRSEPPNPSPAAAQPETEKQVEVKPAGQTDGTSEISTGRQLVDTGSMRGRKRARPEADGMGTNLGFWGR